MIRVIGLGLRVGSGVPTSRNPPLGVIPLDRLANYKRNGHGSFVWSLWTVILFVDLVVVVTPCPCRQTECRRAPGPSAYTYVFEWFGSCVFGVMDICQHGECVMNGASSARSQDVHTPRFRRGWTRAVHLDGPPVDERTHATLDAPLSVAELAQLGRAPHRFTLRRRRGFSRVSR